MRVDTISSILGYDIASPFSTNFWIGCAIKIDPGTTAIANRIALDGGWRGITVNIAIICGTSILHHTVLQKCRGIINVITKIDPLPIPRRRWARIGGKGDGKSICALGREGAVIPGIANDNPGSHIKSYFYTGFYGQGGQIAAAAGRMAHSYIASNDVRTSGQDPGGVSSDMAAHVGFGKGNCWEGEHKGK